MNRFIIRQAKPTDLNDILRLAKILNSSNLPADEPAVDALLKKSEQSFFGKITNPFDRDYVFVVEDTKTGRVVGTSQLVAQHGTKKNPHVYLKLLFRENNTCTFRIEKTEDGPSELGGLILDPEYRKNGYQLGKVLSFVRLAFVAMHPNLFKKTIFADLLPPLENGESHFWNAVGSKYVDVNYLKANRMARDDRNFIYDAFKEKEFEVELKYVDEVGKPGQPTMPAAKLLEQVGFEFKNSVNAFDAGPHYECKVDELRLEKIFDGKQLTINGSVRVPIKFEAPFSPEASFLGKVLLNL